MMRIQEINFPTIERVWRYNLWPGRVSAIEPYSAMCFMDDKYNISFASAPQVFLGGFINERLIADNSLHLAEKYMARSRGLWVDPEYRGNCYGQTMLEETCLRAATLGADAIWSFSRKTSIKSYLAAKFVQTSSWMDHGEFGPNAYVICRVKNDY